MALLSEINDKIKQLMKEKIGKLDTEIFDNHIAVLKSVKAKANAIAKENKVEVNDEILIKAIRKECKELTQTLDMAPQDSSLWSKANLQYNEIKSYLPKELSDEEVLRKVKSIIIVMPSGSNFGMYMNECKNQLTDIEPGRIAKALKEIIK